MTIWTSKNLIGFALAIYRGSKTAPYFEGIEICVFKKTKRPI